MGREEASSRAEECGEERSAERKEVRRGKKRREGDRGGQRRGEEREGGERGADQQSVEMHSGLHTPSPTWEELQPGSVKACVSTGHRMKNALDPTRSAVGHVNDLGAWTPACSCQAAW